MNKKQCFLTAISILLLVTVASANLELGKAQVLTPYPWETQQADQQRSGFTQSPGPSSNQTYWKFQTGGVVTSSPVVANGLVFASSADGYLYAVNATSGAKAWASWVGKAASSPTLTNSKLFIASSQNVYAFNMATGVLVWNQTIGEDTSLGAPLAVGSRLFVGGESAVYAFNEAYGVKLHYQTVPHITGIVRLVYMDGLVVAVASTNRTGYGLNGFEAINTIGRFWMYLEPSGKDKYSSFLINKSAKIFAVVAGTEGSSSAFAVTEMGMMMWEHQIEGATEAFPAFAYNATYIPTSKFIYAMNSTDGAVLWSQSTSGASSTSSPAVADGKLYFGLNDGNVYALDAFNGKPLWTYKTGGPVHSSPAVSNGILYFGSDDGYLYAIGQPTNGTNTIPEFPTLIPLLAAVTVLSAIIWKKWVPQKNNKQRSRTK